MWLSIQRRRWLAVSAVSNLLVLGVVCMVYSPENIGLLFDSLACIGVILIILDILVYLFMVEHSYLMRHIVLTGIILIGLLASRGETEAAYESFYLTQTDKALIQTMAVILLMSVINMIEVKAISRFLRAMEICDTELTAIEVKRVIKKPQTRCREIRGLWSTLFSLMEKQEKVNDERNRLQRVYARHVPAQMEKLLNKASIGDIEPGDTAHIQGILGILKGEGEECITELNRKMQIIIKHQMKQEGVILNHNEDLSTMSIFFDSRINRAVDFGIHCMQEQKDQQIKGIENMVLLLHYTSLQYAIAGSESQAYTVMIYKEAEALSKLMKKLKELAVKLVVTEPAILQLRQRAERRYLGYLELEDSGIKINLYEILDVYEERERRSRIKMKQCFQQGLDLFYQNDFYLARNKFLEVIKECADDLVARWYLFSCEKKINQVDFTQTCYGLLSE